MRRNVVHLKLKRGEKGNFKKHKLVKFIHVTHHCRKKDGKYGATSTWHTQPKRPIVIARTKEST